MERGLEVRDSSVIIVTRLHAGRSNSRFLAGTNNFFPLMSRTSLTPNPILILRMWEGLPPAIKRPSRAADCSSPRSAKVSVRS